MACIIITDEAAIIMAIVRSKELAFLDFFPPDVPTRSIV